MYFTNICDAFIFNKAKSVFNVLEYILLKNKMCIDKNLKA